MFQVAAGGGQRNAFKCQLRPEPEGQGEKDSAPEGGGLSNVYCRLLQVASPGRPLAVCLKNVAIPQAYARAAV